MYIVKETIRFNNNTYLKNSKIDLSENEAKKISNFLDEVKGEKKNTFKSIVVKEDKKANTKSTKINVKE